MAASAFPFVEVRIDTKGLVPTAQRSPGVLAVVGPTAVGAAGGTAAMNAPQMVSTLADAAGLFAQTNASGVVVETPLYASLKLALLQDPGPSKIYGVKTDPAAPTNVAAALASLEGIADITFVTLANVFAVGTATAGATPATGLMALKEHVESVSSQGLKRIGVGMIDPTRVKTGTYVTDATNAVATLKSSVGRMVLVAARGSTQDVATAAAAATAGYDPQVSMVLKKLQGVTIPLTSQYTPSEIVGLSVGNGTPGVTGGINAVIDPVLVPGESLHFADGRTFSTDAALDYIDIVRVLDDIDFRLKAGLIGMVGDARITKQGMTRVEARVDEILGPLVQRNVIVSYDTSIPVLNVLNVPESAWTATDIANVKTARENRVVDMTITVTYGPAVHRLKVVLAPKF